MRLYIDYIFLLHLGINCSYVRVLFGHFGPEYITHLINYGQNNSNGMKKYPVISIGLRPHCKNYWHLNPMNVDDLHNIHLGFQAITR